MATMFQTLHRVMQPSDRLKIACACGRRAELSREEAFARFGPDAAPYEVRRRSVCGGGAAGRGGRRGCGFDPPARARQVSAMCNLYTLDPVLNELAADFETFLGLRVHLSAGPDTLANQPWKTSVWPKYQGLFMRPADPATPTGALEPAVGRWGLVPWMHKGPAKDWKFPTNNCRSEEMHAKPSFRDALKEKRCIIPATYFVEHTGPKGSMTKHKISMADGSPLFLAGLWSRHSFEGETTESYTMVMQEAHDGDDMCPFHNRQPVFLDRQRAATWLDLAADYTPCCAACPRVLLAFDPPEPVAA